MLLIVGTDVDQIVMVCWSLPIIVPVTAARGRSQNASEGRRWSGLVQMAFWSRRMLFGVPARVIGSGFFGGDEGGAGIVVRLWRVR